MVKNVAKILTISGSLREGSYNTKLAKLSAKFASEIGAQATFIDISQYALPLFNEDIERNQGLVENAKKLKRIFADHDGFIICSPEYNSSYSAALKNTIDWISRNDPSDPALTPFKGKIALILAASPGALGGLRGLLSLRMLLENIGIMVLPEQLALGNANQAFDEQGDLKNEKDKEKIHSYISRLVSVIEKLKA